ncbi:MAG: hypothetical protein KGO92_04515 [Bacteroidota bacterium]|nr:hypothetical protein [Bacteroidota bacterium]
MKHLLKICSLALFMSGTVRGASAPADQDVAKSKTYSKSYALSNSDKVLLDNSFGEMKINTWSKNEVKVDVSITVKAGTEENAQRILDIVNIEDGKNNGEVFFKTHLNNKKDDWKENNKEKNQHTSFNINYTVYLPTATTLEATNQFGAMVIGDYEGPVTLNSKFGSLTAGKLGNAKKVKVEFGKATIESMHNGDLSIHFSRAQVNQLSGDIDADFQQSNGVKINLENQLTKLDIKNNFSKVYLVADKNLSASFDIKTSFGSFNNKTSFNIPKLEDSEKKYFNKNQSYSGKAGNGQIPVNIKSNFGSITLDYDIAFDVNEKPERHSKSRA